MNGSNIMNSFVKNFKKQIAGMEKFAKKFKDNYEYKETTTETHNSENRLEISDMISHRPYNPKIKYHTII